MRNITEIHFSNTTGNGKFSGKPDLPVEIFFLGHGGVHELVGVVNGVYAVVTIQTNLLCE